MSNVNNQSRIKAWQWRAGWWCCELIRNTKSRTKNMTWFTLPRKRFYIILLCMAYCSTLDDRSECTENACRNNCSTCEKEERWKWKWWLTARTSAVPVSMEPSRVSPILMEMTWAPGAIPHFSTSPSKYPAAIHATCVPWAPETNNIQTWMLRLGRHSWKALIRVQTSANTNDDTCSCQWGIPFGISSSSFSYCNSGINHGN